MKIVMLSGSYLPEINDVSRYTQLLKQKMTDIGHDVALLTDFSSADQTLEDNVFGTVSGWRNRDLIPLTQAILHQRPDVLHIQHAPANYHFRRAIGWLPFLLRGFGGLMPIVSTLHEYGNREWLPRGLSNDLVRRWHRWGEARYQWDRENYSLLAQSQIIISTVDYTTRLLLSRFPEFEHKLRQFRPGGNITLYPASRASVRKKLNVQFGWPDNAIILAYLGNIQPGSGLETLLSAFAQAQSRRPNLRLLIMGSNKSMGLSEIQTQKYWDKLQTKIKTFKLNNQVRFTQRISDALISGYLVASDLGILPSDNGVNLTHQPLIDMFRHRLPVIVTQRHPNETQLERQLFAKVIKPLDIESLRQSIHQFSRSAIVRKKLGRLAQEFATQFSWERLEKQHIQLYQEMGRLATNRFSQKQFASG